MAKSKGVYRTEEEFKKLKEHYEEKLRQTKSKAWETRFKKELSGLKKSWAQKQRIAQMKAANADWKPFGGKKGSAERLHHARQVRLAYKLFAEKTKSHKTNVQRRKQEKILYGKVKTKLIKTDFGREFGYKKPRTGEQHLRAKITKMHKDEMIAKSEGLPVEVNVANVHDYEQSVYDALKEEQLPIKIKDLTKMSKEQAKRMSEDPYIRKRLTDTILNMKDYKVRERLMGKFEIEPPKVIRYTNRTYGKK